MAAVTICSDFGAPKNKVWHCFHFCPISHEVMGPDAMVFIFWMLSFKPTFSLYSFTFIKRLFGSSSLSAIRVVLSAYLRLLIFLPAILIPACVSSRPAFLMMYSAYKLNKQGDNIQPWCTPFPIWNKWSKLQQKDTKDRKNYFITIKYSQCLWSNIVLYENGLGLAVNIYCPKKIKKG